MADHYRMTRAAFDVMSVFGSLGATALPTQAFAVTLAARGYSTSNVRNRLARLVGHGLLVSERRGRASVLRRAAHSDATYARLGGATDEPPWTGSFAALLLTIPESRRADRDRVLYAAKAYMGYRQLRAGVLIGFVDTSHELAAHLGVTTGAGIEGVEACTIAPRDDAQARAWVRRAFELEALAGEVASVGARVEAAVASSHTTEARCFDLFYEASQLALRVPGVPRALLPDGTERLAATLGDDIARLMRSWGERFGAECVQRALALPDARLIEFDEAHWRRIGVPMPNVT